MKGVKNQHLVDGANGEKIPGESPRWGVVYLEQSDFNDTKTVKSQSNEKMHCDGDAIHTTRTQR